MLYTLHVICSMLHCTQVRPVCLPSPATDYDSRQATVTGWGTTAQGGLLSSLLQKVGFRIGNKCKMLYLSILSV